MGDMPTVTAYNVEHKCIWYNLEKFLRIAIIYHMLCLTPEEMQSK